MTVFLTADRRAVLRRHVLPQAQLPAADGRDRRRVAQPPRRARQQRRAALVKAIGTSATVRPAAAIPTLDAVNAALERIAGTFDAEWGGFGQAPEVPVDDEHRARAAGRTWRRAPRRPARIVTTSLDAMASGGMYDHIGGGFARYSVDREWLVPHFEKMLYDQALLARAYLHGVAVLGHARWLQVVDETIEYVLRDLRHPDGGFYSAEDADSPDEHGHGHEGLFYTWTPAEVRTCSRRRRGCRRRPRLVRHHRRRQLRGALDPQPPGRRAATRAAARGRGGPPRLFDARARRRRPLLDDKVLTEWNALFLATLAEAAAMLGRADWLAAAIANGEFLLRELRRRRRSLAPVVAGRRHAARSPRRARRRPRRPRRRVHPARRGDRARRVDRRRARDGRRDARPLLGRRPRWRCSRRPTTPSSSSSARRTSSTTPRRRPTRPPRSPSPGSPRSPASCGTRTTPTGSCSCSAP